MHIIYKQIHSLFLFNYRDRDHINSNYECSGSGKMENKSEKNFVVKLNINHRSTNILRQFNIFSLPLCRQMTTTQTPGKNILHPLKGTLDYDTHFCKYLAKRNFSFNKNWGFEKENKKRGTVNTLQSCFYRAYIWLKIFNLLNFFNFINF